MLGWFFFIIDEAAYQVDRFKQWRRLRKRCEFYELCGYKKTPSCWIGKHNTYCGTARAWRKEQPPRPTDHKGAPL